MTFKKRLSLSSLTFILISFFATPSFSAIPEVIKRTLTEEELYAFQSESDLNVRPDFYQTSLRNGKTKVFVGGEARYRFELRNNYNFNDRTFEDDTLHLSRLRLHAEAELNPSLTFFVEGQSSLSFAQSKRNESDAFVNKLDLHQLYAEIKSPFPAFPLEVKVGRQKLSYGDERFIGAFEWGNVARTFDAVKTTWRPLSWFESDFFFAQPVLVKTTRADSADHRDNLYGLYSTLGPHKNHVLDTFLFIRHSRGRDFASEIPTRQGELKEFTLGNRLKGKTGSLDYGLEWAWQFGSKAKDEIDAWALHTGVGYTFKDVWSKPRLGFEFNHGSGDSDPTDGRVETFDNLFPTNHKFYGDADFASLWNMNHLQFDLKFEPHQRVAIKLAQHFFRLDTPSSPWFNASGAVMRPRNPAASKTVGTETDLTANINLHPRLNLLVGYAHFAAGPFIDDSGAHDNADLLYVMSGFQF